MGLHMTDFLYARPSFVGGMGRAFDLGGTMMEFNRSRSGEYADTVALRMDWGVVMDDLRQAVAQCAAAMTPEQRARLARSHGTQ